MMKNLKKIAALVACAMTTGVLATDNRAPVIVTRGPLTYSFEKLHKTGLNLNMWSIVSTKDANKSFLKHGTNTHPLTSIMFNRESFKLQDAFGKTDGKYNTEYFSEDYNTLNNTSILYPRVTYKEQAMNLGGRIDYPVYKDKGRIGLRLNVPVKHVRMERDNDSEMAVNGEQDVRIVNDPAKVEYLQDGGTGAVKTIDTYFFPNLYNYSAVETLPVYDGANWLPLVQYDTTSGVKMLDKNYYKQTMAGTAEATNYTKANPIPFVLVYNKNTNMLPFGRGNAVMLQDNVRDSSNELVFTSGGTDDVKEFILNANTSAKNKYYQTTTASQKADIYMGALKDLAADGSSVSETELYAFKKGVDYSQLSADYKSHLWLATIQTTVDQGQNRVEPKVYRAIDSLLDRYSQPVEEWLFENGFQFATHETTGLGDSDLDVFYEHMFSTKWIGELNLGVKVPTGSSSNRKYSGNPYRAQLGNSSHWEIKVGGNVQWDAFKWMAMKLDLMYSFALERTEQRAAAFKGATVKNIGPRADADVDWSYFVGNFDLQFRHPKYSKLSSVLGYQLYYKTEDHISFKNSTTNLNSWFGQRWNTSTKAFEDFTVDLDNSVARKNTQSIGHRVRFEGSWEPKQYVDFFVGGAYTFAGKNIPRETDMHAGVNVKF